MVQVIIKIYNDKYSGFQVQGHSGFAERGKDIVCSGISAITQCAVMGLQYYIEDKIELKVKEGFLKCEVDLESLSEIDMERTQVILQTMLLGLKSIQKEYREYLSIVKKRRLS